MAPRETSSKGVETGRAGGEEIWSWLQVLWHKLLKMLTSSKFASAMKGGVLIILLSMYR